MVISTEHRRRWEVAGSTFQVRVTDAGKPKAPASQVESVHKCEMGVLIFNAAIESAGNQV